jgi:FemAB-related protein (PEP-CTERM system-associated)
LMKNGCLRTMKVPLQNPDGTNPNCVPNVLAYGAAMPVPATPVLVHPLQVNQDQDWDDFVWRRPEATFFHLTGWKRVVEKTFCYRARYLLAMRRERVTGILPLFETSNWLQGKCLISTPMAVYGGICAEDEESRNALLDAAKRMAREENVQHLELRQPKGDLFPDFHLNPLYSTFSGELDPNPETMLKRLPRDTRYMIRKSQKSGLQLECGHEQVAPFYGLFLQSMRRLGTPTFPHNWFDNLVQEFNTLVDVMMLSSNGAPVAGVFSFRFRDTILPYYAGASSEAPRLAANNLLYWELMTRSAAEGIRNFDFGRSKKGTGAYGFKMQWNMAVCPLTYQLYLVKRKSVPNFTPLNPKFERAARIWSKLPLELTRQLGPHIVRWFP